MDNTFGSANPSLFPGGEPNVARLLARPLPRRIYFRILHEYTSGYWQSATAGPFLDQVSRDVGVAASGLKGTIDAIRNGVVSAVRSSTTAGFQILTNAGADITTQADMIELEGQAPVQAATIVFTRNDGEPIRLEAAWTSHLRWRADLALPTHTNRFEFLGFDSEGGLVGSARITVINSLAGDGPQVDLWTPKTGPDSGGTEVTFVGTGFEVGLRVFFGAREAREVRHASEHVIIAVTPAAPAGLPASGEVQVEIVLGEYRVTLEQPFTYEVDPRSLFIRGDSNRDRRIDLSDPIRTLGYLFLGGAMSCADGADFNDDGKLEISDAVAALSFLFQAGARPSLPYPDPGRDPTDDGLRCE
jgi:hypothetical protein